MDHSKSIVSLYEKNTEYWLRRRATSTFFEKKYLDWILDNTTSGDSILDIGCGTGKPIAEYFIKNNRCVHGVDSSISMIQYAKGFFPSEKWTVLNMLDIDFNSEFNAVLAWDSFFHLCHEDQRKMIPLFARALQLNGLLVFTSGPEHGVAMGEFNGEPLYHASLASEEYRELLSSSGFEVVEYCPKDKECGEHTVWKCKLTLK